LHREWGGEEGKRGRRERRREKGTRERKRDGVDDKSDDP